MFDNYHIRSGGAIPYEKTVTVTEKRATTDESVRLLRELKDEAERSVVAAFLTKDNSLINGVVTLNRVSIAGYSTDLKAGIGFKLNGKEHIAFAEVNHNDFYRDKPAEVIRLLTKRLADAIMYELKDLYLEELSKFKA